MHPRLRHLDEAIDLGLLPVIQLPVTQRRRWPQLTGMAGLGGLSGLTGNGQSGGFLPSSLLNLLAWYDPTLGLHTVGAAHFDGTAYLESLTAPATGTAVSFACWVKMSDTDADRVFMLQGDSSGPANAQILTRTAANRFEWTVNGGVTSLTSTVDVEQDTWYFVAGTFDGTNANLYVDADLDVGPTASTITAAVDRMRLGSLLDGSQLFFGYIDNACVWAKALSQAEVTRLYNLGRGLSSKDFTGSLLTGLVYAGEFDGYENILSSYVGSITLNNHSNVVYGEGVVVSTILFHDDCVSQWDDQSGNSNHLKQTNALRRPVYKANRFNGLPTIMFRLPSVFDFTPDNQTLHAVFTMTQPAQYFTRASQLLGDAGFRYLFDGATVNNSAALVTISSQTQWGLSTVGRSGGTTQNTFVLAQNTWKTFTALFNGPDSETWLDNTSQGVVDMGTAGLDIGGITVGGRADGDFALGGEIAEFFVTDGPVTADLRMQAQNYLTTKYTQRSPAGGGTLDLSQSMNLLFI